MNKRLLFFISILFAVGASSADGLWDASPQEEIWGDENKSPSFVTDSYKTKEEKKATVHKQAHQDRFASTQQTPAQVNLSSQQNSSEFNEWSRDSHAGFSSLSDQLDILPTGSATSDFELIPVDNFTSSKDLDLIPADNSTANKDFDLIPADNSTASEDFDLIPTDNSTANDQFDLIPVENTCKGNSSSEQVKAEQARLAQIKAELAIAKQQKENLEKANKQKEEQAKAEQQKVDQLKAEQLKIQQANAEPAKKEQAAAAAVPAPQPKPQAQPSKIKIHWIPLSICAGVAITGGILAVIFDNKASDAANRIPVNHNTYKQSYDDAGSYQTKRNIAIGVAAAGLVGAGITFLF